MSFRWKAESPRARWLRAVRKAVQEKAGPGPGSRTWPGCAVWLSGSCMQRLCRLWGGAASTDETLIHSLTLPETKLSWFRFCDSKNDFLNKSNVKET